MAFAEGNKWYPTTAYGLISYIGAEIVRGLQAGDYSLGQLEGLKMSGQQLGLLARFAEMQHGAYGVKSIQPHPLGHPSKPYNYNIQHQWIRSIAASKQIIFSCLAGELIPYGVAAYGYFRARHQDSITNLERSDTYKTGLASLQLLYGALVGVLDERDTRRDLAVPRRAALGLYNDRDHPIVRDYDDRIKERLRAAASETASQHAMLPQQLDLFLRAAELAEPEPVLPSNPA